MRALPETVPCFMWSSILSVIRQRLIITTSSYLFYRLMRRYVGNINASLSKWITGSTNMSKLSSSDFFDAFGCFIIAEIPVSNFTSTALIFFSCRSLASLCISCFWYIFVGGNSLDGEQYLTSDLVASSVSALIPYSRFQAYVTTFWAFR